MTNIEKGNLNTLSEKQRNHILRLAKFSLGSHYSVNVPKSEKFKAVISKRNKEHPTMLGKKYSEKSKDQMSESRINYMRKNYLYVSNPEHLFYLKILIRMFPLRLVKKQYVLKGLRHAFDFAIPEAKMLFEIDGDYYHSLISNIKRDAYVNEFVYRTYPDWTLLRYNDSDLRRMEVL